MLVFLTVFLPVYCFVLWRWIPLGPRWFRWGWHTWALLGGAVLTGAVLAEFPLAKISSWLPLYMVGLAAYVEFLGNRDDYKHFNKVLALAAMAVFVVADWWEIPVFIYGGLGLGYQAWTGAWFDQIHRLYVLVTLVLFWKLGGFKLTRKTAMAVIVTTGLDFLVLLPGLPGPLNFWPTAARILCLGAFGLYVLPTFQPVTQNSYAGRGFNRVARGRNIDGKM